MRPAPIIGLLCALMMPACRSTPARPDVESIAQREYQARDLPGLAVVVLTGSESSFARGYGGIAGGSAISPTTTFQLGSIGKQFLAALVLAMTADGQLSLGEPVTKYLNDFPLLNDGIQIRHLLSHTSGVRELFTLPEAQEGFDNLSRTRDELIAAIRKAPVDFPAGARWSYSNTNYTMLALIVERIAGKPYEDVLAERFFRPFNLTSMRQCASVPTAADEARGHERKNNANVLSAPENMNWIRGDGGLCGNAQDLARWTRLLSIGQILPPALFTSMSAPTQLSDGTSADYGFALSLVRPDGPRKIAHNGAMRGFSASAAYYPESGTTIVVLTNRGDVRTEAIERAIARHVIGVAEPDRRDRSVPAAQREHAIGTYDIGVFDVHVVDRNGRLWFEMPQPGPTFPLRPVGDGTFVNADDPDANSLYFNDLEQPAPQLRFYMGGMNWYGRRVSR
jgi:CubicO group peptidase (beta-lactamase class C family)